MSRAGTSGMPRRGGFAPLRLALIGLLSALVLSPRPLLARAETNKPPPSSNRYLVVVETSRSMKGRADAVLQTVQDLLKSGMGGQLRRGDTMGIWTYNESLYAGRFPLQSWLPESQKDITGRTLTFLKAQKYEKLPNIDKVLPALTNVIKGSACITIILVSSGEEKIHGTPFDDRINSFYQQWLDAQQKARMPFVTVLRGLDGKLADFTVNTPPWPVQMPRLPQATQTAVAVQSQIPKVVTNAPPRIAAPLILSGKKPPPEPTPAPKPEPSTATLQAPAPPPEATSSNKSTAVNPPSPPAQPTQMAQTGTAPSFSSNVSASLPAAPAAASTPVSEPKPIVGPPRVTQPTAIPPAKPEPASVPSTSHSEPKPAAGNPTKPPPSLPPEQVPERSVASENTPGPTTVTTQAALASPASTSHAPHPSAPATAPGQAGTAVPAESFVRHTGIWIVGLIVFGIAFVFFFLLHRRGHAAPGASLITQSFERKQKP